jgi:long-chain fatty acid transport protein
MKMKTLTALMLATIPASSVFAAALDRSGQSIAPFLQAGNYAEIGGSLLIPDVQGTDRNKQKVNDIGDSYAFANGALKIQATDMISFGLIFDEPFGADATYRGDNAFTTANNGNTKVDVQSRNLTALIGLKPITGLTLYGGAAYQEVEGDIKLRGTTYSAFSGYDATVKRDGDFGWVAGAAYEIPDIALKASITYRSEIEHQASTREAVAFAGQLAALNAQTGGIGAVTQGITALNAGLTQINGGLAQMAQLPDTHPQKAALLAQKVEVTARLTTATTALNGLRLLTGLSTLPSVATTTTEIITPQSVNLDLQSGIMADTVAFANIRWVDWSNFSIRPTNFGKAANIASAGLTGGAYTQGFNLVDYSDDQWTINAGLGRKLTNTIGGTVSVGWDSGAGNPVTTLGPTEGYWNVGLGLRYSPTPKVDLSGGIKYFWLGDAKAQTGSYSVPGNTAASYAGNFTGNDALALGLKLGYHF